MRGADVQNEKSAFISLQIPAGTILTAQVDARGGVVVRRVGGLIPTYLEHILQCGYFHPVTAV